MLEVKRRARRGRLSRAMSCGLRVRRGESGRMNEEGGAILEVRSQMSEVRNPESGTLAVLVCLAVRSLGVPSAPSGRSGRRFVSSV
jgi:hypothetical protein